jgi:4-diphosphocytidyl-2-C-methyl-D-erythritol kinase
VERALRRAPRGRVRRSARSLRLPSYAKLNLGLEVLGIRRDGYHELRTIFQTISLRDQVRVGLRPPRAGLSLSCDAPGVPGDRTNLAARAAFELARFARRPADVRIEIVKRIPVAGGLGGGSSNAATVLLGLDRLWRLGLGPAGLQPLARRIGADVPFFLTGGTALGLARGDEVYSLGRQVRAHVVVASPERPLSTAAVFRRVDSGLTLRENSYTIYRFVSSDLEGNGDYSLLSNDLETAALKEAPDLAGEVRRIRRVLVRRGARLVSLSGSGSSVFGLFDDARGARLAHQALREAGVPASRGRTVTRGQYRKVWARALGK